jgi:GrpB-like predicted nucleotidyltransferase (UPF0157 family)
MLGLKRGSVLLRDHQPCWADAFVIEAKRLVACAGDLIEDVQHVGSTAVRDLPAKPILDIAVAVASTSLIPRLAERLSSLGYIYRGYAGRDGGHLFLRESVPDVRLVHLHALQRDDPQWQEYLDFRDTLRTDASLREQYAQLKTSLAGQFPTDRPSYTASKEVFIRNVLGQRRKPDR